MAVNLFPIRAYLRASGEVGFAIGADPVGRPGFNHDLMSKHDRSAHRNGGIPIRYS